jgi:MinD superfamily P-loop ATPase
MKEIVVLSGKGGVGKSSLTASIGSLLSHKYKLVLADTDVDAPNLHIVLGADQTLKEEIKASDKAFINYDLCSGCMACVDTCQFSSIIGNDEPVMVSYSCEGCGACTITCPENAIEIKPVINGSLNYFDASNIKVVAGELDIGESSSGRLVDVVKRKARETAESYQVDLMLTDGPPGIGCPVIASLKGADYVLLVTEPTPTALHDLQRVIKVVEYFKTPIGIVINKADMHKQTQEVILQFVKENDFDLLAEIPYDRALPLALSEGKLVVTAYPDTPASLAIQSLAEKINVSILSS